MLDAAATEIGSTTDRQAATVKGAVFLSYTNDRRRCHRSGSGMAQITNRVTNDRTEVPEHQCLAERIPGVEGRLAIFSIRGFADGPRPACHRCRGTTAIGGVLWPIAQRLGP